MNRYICLAIALARLTIPLGGRTEKNVWMHVFVAVLLDGAHFVMMAIAVTFV